MPKNRSAEVDRLSVFVTIHYHGGGVLLLHLFVYIGKIVIKTLGADTV